MIETKELYEEAEGGRRKELRQVLDAASEQASVPTEDQVVLNERWRRFKEGAFYDPPVEFEQMEIPNSTEWIHWRDWDQVFDRLNELAKVDKNDLMGEIWTNSNVMSDILALITTLFVNKPFFHYLRERYPLPDYQSAWDRLFFACTDYGIGISTVSLNRCCDMSDIDFRGLNPKVLIDEFADLRRANLSGCDLKLANLKNANLSGADLTNADLTDASLIGHPKLEGAKLDGANFSGAKFTNQFPDDLPNWAKKQAKIRD